MPLSTASNQLRTQIHIGLGGNIANELGTPKDHLVAAARAFVKSGNFEAVAISSLYQSCAYGVTDQPDFVNAVLCAITILEPLALLDFCQNLEIEAGRMRRRHWGERCLDVDILIFGDKVIDHPRLVVPHKELHLRNFVVIPLLELNPDMVINDRSLKDCAVASNWQGLTKISPPIL